MSDAPTIKSKILFVDDDPSFLQMIRDVFGEACRGAWDIHTAVGGGEALQRLRTAKFDLAVIDVFMPGMDGLQLLRVLNQDFPNLPKVLLTGMPDANTRTAALEGGAALFLEKPANAAGYESVFATLNELLRWHQRFSSHGQMRSLGLLDLVKLECKSGNSRLFEVFIADLRGEIYVQAGDIIHAIMPDRRGQSAFTYLTTASGAVFYLRQFVEPIERSINRQWEFLIMEATQVAEQLATTVRPANELTIAAPVLAPTPPEVLKPAPLKLAPAALAPKPPPPTAAPAPVPLPTPVHQLKSPQAGAPARTDVEAHVAPEWKIADAPDGLALPLENDGAELKVEELVLCSDFREVLFETHCLDPQKRLKLAESLFQNAGELSRSLPLSELERVELLSSGSRMVLRLDGKRCLLVRTNSKSHPPQPDANVTGDIQEWLDQPRLARGLLAAAIISTDGRVRQHSFVPDYSNDVLHLVAREAGQLLDVALKFSFAAWLVRVIYARTQVYSLRRHDGMVLCLFLSRDGHDTAAVQRMLDGFNQLRG
ncbi:MAG: hypothetical protein RLY20_2203 [Verrucomicrobiota bacterium]|jgi:CheY-like chemotaxis protein